MRYPDGRPIEYYQKRQWGCGVDDRDLVRDVFTPRRTSRSNLRIRIHGRDTPLQPAVIALYRYIQSCPGGVDTHTFLRDGGTPDLTAAADFYDRVITRFADLAPAGLGIYTIRDGHVVHLIADEVQIHEPTGQDAQRRLLAIRAANAAYAAWLVAKEEAFQPIFPLMDYLLRKNWENYTNDTARCLETLTFLDAHGQPDHAAAQRGAVVLRERIRAGNAESYMLVDVQGHLLRVWLGRSEPAEPTPVWISLRPVVYVAPVPRTSEEIQANYERLRKMREWRRKRPKIIADAAFFAEVKAYREKCDKEKQDGSSTGVDSPKPET